MRHSQRAISIGMEVNGSKNTNPLKIKSMNIGEEMEKEMFEQKRLTRSKQLSLEVHVLESIEKFIENQENKDDFNLQLVNSVLLKIASSYSQKLVDHSVSFKALMNFKK